MNIKLHAKLSAYSRVNNLQNNLPEVTEHDAGSFLGVGSNGSYTLFKNASSEDINVLFDSDKTSLIDSLFE